MAVMQWFNAVAFTVLGLVSLRFAISRSGDLYRWAAVASISLAIVFVASALRLEFGGGSPINQLLTAFFVALFTTFPWALYRMSRTVAPHSKRWTGWIADAVLVLLVVPTPFIDFQTIRTEPTFWNNLYVVVVLTEPVALTLVASAKIMWASRGQSTVVAKRLLAVGVAALILGWALVAAFTRFGSSGHSTRLISQILAITAAIIMCAALAAPKALRQYWNRANEAAINTAVGEIISYANADDSIHGLLPPLAQTCGSKEAAFFGADGSVRACYGLGAEEALRRRTNRASKQRIEVQLKSGSIAVWTQVLWPFPADDELQILRNIGGIIDLVVARSDAEEMSHQLEIRTRVEESLRDQAGELKRVNSELNQFVAVASHDLQAPMRNILDYVDFLRQDLETDLPPNAEEDLHFITTAAGRMRELIEALLSYTRVGSAAIPLTARVDVTDVVDTTLQTLALHITAPDARVEVGHLPTIQGDQTTLSQLFSNLVENSIKYRSSERAPRIRIHAEAGTGSHTYFVQDNGEGVPAEFQTRIFTMFKRLHSDDEVPGTGIGLAICQRIVERHGGTIWVQESSTDGTTICFTLHDRHEPGRELAAPAVADLRQTNDLVGRRQHG
jgi:signal transduction histidine kinase